ncbi:hypothetical protein BH23THE1_BH23THE1_27170 [soil metagenome]
MVVGPIWIKISCYSRTRRFILVKILKYHPSLTYLIHGTIILFTEDMMNPFFHGSIRSYFQLNG